MLFGQYMKCTINSDIINIYPIIKLYLDYLFEYTNYAMAEDTANTKMENALKGFFLYACCGFIADFTTRKETISNKVGVVFSVSRPQIEDCTR